jgi:hypothetical protein
VLAYASAHDLIPNFSTLTTRIVFHVEHGRCWRAGSDGSAGTTLGTGSTGIRELRARSTWNIQLDSLPPLHRKIRSPQLLHIASSANWVILRSSLDSPKTEWDA